MRYFSLLLFCFISISAYATHNRSGEISYKHLSGYLYEITVTTYTNKQAAADRDTLLVSFAGSDTIMRTIFRTNGPDATPANGIPDGEPLPCTDMKKNIYILTYDFLSPGVYRIVMEDPNRTSGTVNIPNPINTPFSIDAVVVVDSVAPNSSVFFETYPAYFININNIFRHNPAVIDPEGDSLVFELDTCLGLSGKPVPGYTIPAGITMNPVNGEFVWDMPSQLGEYSFRIKISEWRNGKYLGYTSCDFMVKVDNNPVTAFEFDSLKAWQKNTGGDYEIHVPSGQNINLKIHYKDPQIPMVDLNAFGSVFVISNKATFTKTTLSNTYTGLFSWLPWIGDVRSQPYIVTFRGSSTESTKCFFHDVTLMIYVEVITGTSEITHKQPSFTVVPNPINGSALFVVDDEKVLSEKPILLISDIAGRKVMEQAIFSKETRINQADFVPGMYFYSLVGNNNSIISSGKMIVE